MRFRIADAPPNAAATLALPLAKERLLPFFMYPSPGAGTNQASCAFWKVSDVPAVVRWLKVRGVVFEEYDLPGMKTVDSIFTGGGAKAAWFKDSEGNIMAVVQDDQV
jgi:hypothetical protein